MFTPYRRSIAIAAMSSCLKSTAARRSRTCIWNNHKETMMRERVSYSLAIVWLVVGMTSRAAEPKLHRASPQVAQRGTTVDVDLTGYFLKDAKGLLFYDPGVTVESFEAITEQEVNGKKVPQATGTRLRVRLKISESCPLGPIGFRLQTVGGLSEYQRFFVSPFSTTLEADESRIRNDDLEKSQPVQGNTTVVGTLREGYDLDTYKLTAKQGQRISAEVIAARLGVDRGLPDLHLLISNATGHVLAEADDSALYLQDPVLSVQVPEDGDYFVNVRHSLYSANNDIYVLHLGYFARPIAVYPSGGPAGTELEVTIHGDPLGVQRQSIPLPTEATVGLATKPIVMGEISQEISVELRDAVTQSFAPTPNKLRVSPFGNILESGANQSPEEISGQAAAELPIAFNGIIESPGDVDCFKFKAKKGEQLRIHGLASGLGSPVDLAIWIKSTSGKGRSFEASDSRLNHHGLPGTNGVDRVTVDPILFFTAPDDDEYVLGVEDERGNGGDANVYRIECQSDWNATFVYIPPEPENRFAPQARQVINVPAGGRYNTTLSIVNTNRAYTGNLLLKAIGLPEGVEMIAPPITPDMTRVPVVFSASPNAGNTATFAELSVHPIPTADSPNPESLQSGFRQTVVMNSPGNNDYYLQIPLQKLAIAVTETAPFDLEVEEPRGSLVQNGELPLKFKIKRNEGFDDPVTVMMEWKPNGINTVTPLNLPGDQEEGEYLISAARNATVGTFFVTLTAVNGNYQPQYRDPNARTFISSKPFSLSIAEPHLDARFARAAVERGKTSNLVVTLNHLKPFAGKAKLSLTRLPRGVEVLEDYREITSSDKEVSFTLKATDESLVGSYRGMTLDVTIDDNGQVVRQFTGYGTLRVDAQRRGNPDS